jgi:hypothetical protein
MNAVRTVADGLTAWTPAVNAVKLDCTGGNSVPPMQPTIPRFETDAATMPARNDGSSNEKLIAARFFPVVFPPVVT